MSHRNAGRGALAVAIAITGALIAPLGSGASGVVLPALDEPGVADVGATRDTSVPDVVSVIQLSTLTPTVEQAVAHAAAVAGGVAVPGRSVMVGMSSLTRGSAVVQQPPAGYLIPMGLTVLFGLGLGRLFAGLAERPLLGVAALVSALALWNQQYITIFNNRMVAKRSEPHTIIIAQGNSVRHFTVKPWVMATVGTVAIAFATGYLMATSYLVFRDDLIGASIARQARMQHSYEDRISALRSQVDRIISRQLLDQELM